MDELWAEHIKPALSRALDLAQGWKQWLTELLEEASRLLSLHASRFCQNEIDNFAKRIAEAQKTSSVCAASDWLAEEAKVAGDLTIDVMRDMLKARWLPMMTAKCALRHGLATSPVMLLSSCLCPLAPRSPSRTSSLRCVWGLPSSQRVG